MISVLIVCGWRVVQMTLPGSYSHYPAFSIRDLVEVELTLLPEMQAVEVELTFLPERVVEVELTLLPEVRVVEVELIFCRKCGW